MLCVCVYSYQNNLHAKGLIPGLFFYRNVVAGCISKTIAHTSSTTIIKRIASICISLTILIQQANNKTSFLNN